MTTRRRIQLGSGLVILAIMIVGGYEVSKHEPELPPPVLSSVPRPATADADSLVATLRQRHAVMRVDPANEEALVYAAFWDYCDVDQKRSVVAILANYCKAHEPRYGGAVTVKDAATGRKLAEYSVFGGIKLAGE